MEAEHKIEDEDEDENSAKDRRLVILELPFPSGTPLEQQPEYLYAQKCVLESMQAGEAPVLLHWVLNTFGVPHDCLSTSYWYTSADVTRFCIDCGWSDDMVKTLSDSLDDYHELEVQGNIYEVQPPEGFVYIVTDRVILGRNGQVSPVSSTTTIRRAQ